MEEDKVKDTSSAMSVFCTSSPMPVKMISILKKKKPSGIQLGEKYQTELPALLSQEVSWISLVCRNTHQDEII